jgi:Na+-transporting NADH:ubiquinone oxidoreductase subunit F
MLEIGFAIILFTLFVTLLALLVQLAHARLVPGGPVNIELGGGALRVQALAGHSLLEALNDADVLLPSSCAGRGSCGLCRVTVLSGGGAVSPVEDARLSKQELRAGLRLACQVRILQDLRLELPEGVLGVRQYTCTLTASRHLTPFVKELTLALPGGETMDIRPGTFVQVTAPAHRLAFTTIEVTRDARAKWDALRLWDLSSGCDEPTTRAYSLANGPHDTGGPVLLVRLAVPAPGAPADAPAGTVSSWLFSLRPGAGVPITGPFGHFFPVDSEREMIYIGGGVGMAPIRSHILDLLERRRSQRVISFWYGARSRAELLYEEQFERLAAGHPNFAWQPALSEPQPDSGWQGPTGFIHQVLYDRYLADHPAPEDCEYYLCGPPMMVRAVRNMLDGLGVAPERISFDDFGSSSD